MGRKGRAEKRSGRRPRFINPLAQEPERWTLRRVVGGKYAIVDQDGIPVLDHYDPTTRLFNRHLAKAAPVQRFALVHAHRFIEQLQSPFADWILRLITDAMAEGLPHIQAATQTIQEGNDKEVA